MTVLDPRYSDAGLSRLVAGVLPHSLFYDLSLGLLLSIGVLIVLTFPEYGIIWDEEVQRQYGLLLLNYYASGSDRPVGLQLRQPVSLWRRLRYGGGAAGAGVALWSL